MAFTLDNSQQNSLGPATFSSFSYTAGAGSDLIIVAIGGSVSSPRTSVAPTFDGETMTQIESQEINGETVVELFYLAENITSGSSVTVDIINKHNSGDTWVVTASYTVAGGNVAEFVSSVANTGVGATISNSITPSETGGLIFDMTGTDWNIGTSSNNRTLLYADDEGAYNMNTQYYINPPASSTTMEWTNSGSNDWNTILAFFRETGGATIPTITPDTADSTNFGADTTPTLEFTGEDTGGDDLTYNIQIDLNNTFDSQSSGVEEVDSYSETNRDTQQIMYNGGSISRIGSAFTGNDKNITTAELYLSRTGSPTGTMRVDIYSDDGTGLSPDTLLASSDTIDPGTVSTSFELVEFEFTGGDIITLSSGTTYWVVAYGDNITGGGSSDRINVGRNSGVSTPEYVRWTGASWQNISGALCFYVYSESTGPLLDKLSDTDVGFANEDTPADTDPFNEGEQISYTVQGGDALSTNTYYWRVRAKDPGDSNAWTAWTTTREFDVNTGGGGLPRRLFIIT